MRKTKIVCTLGPATDDEKILRAMIDSGMNVARFNFSHGTHEEQLIRLNSFKKVRAASGKPVAALLDTKGPEIRLGTFKDGGTMLNTDQFFTLTPSEIEGDNDGATVSYKTLSEDIKVGCRILLDDGKIDMIVAEICGSDIKCKVLNGGYVSNRKGVNIPGVRLSLPYISAQDHADILFGIENDFDFIAASFTRTANDILEIRSILDQNGGDDINIIAKIENQEGLDNIDEIIESSNGIMIARGDMGVEIDFTEIPIIQKELISKCYKSGRPAITATQMLDSMMSNPRPTRAEITDVANAIYDGTSAIMLSGETAAGEYPLESVQTMAAIAERTESDISYEGRFTSRTTHTEHLTVPAAVAHATVATAMDVRARAIISVTKSGETAKLLSKNRPGTPIYACVLSEKIYQQLSLSWGITPLIMPYANNTDELINASVKVVKAAGYIENGNLVVITAGVPVGIPGTTNMIKTHLVGDAIVQGIGIGLNNATGRICTARNLTELKEKFVPGDILVVKRTSNEMMEYIKESSAYISEETGRNSHSSILALALNKSAIIAANNALSRLKDGQLVAVDVKHGIVKIMPE